MLNQLYGSNGQATVDLTQGLVAHYLLNNNGDDSYGTHDGTPSGGVDFQGDVSKFDGLDDKVTIPSPIPNSGNITVSVWFTVDAITNALLTIFSLFDNNTMYLVARDEVSFTNYLRAQIGDSGYMYPTFPLVANTLYHAVLVGDISLGTAKLYINGNLEFTSTLYTANDVLGRQDTIGAYTTNATTFDYYQDGTVSNLRIYNEAKNQTFIDALYAEGYYPKPLPLPTTDGLIAHYPLTGTAEDLQGEGGNESGTEYNGVAFVDESFFKGDKFAIFDGVDDYIDCGSSMNFNNTSWTISHWVKFTQTTAWRTFNNRGQGSLGAVSGFQISSSDNATYGNTTVDDGAGTSIGLTSIPFNENDGKWHNLTVTWDTTTGTLSLYIDKVFKGSSTNAVLIGANLEGLNEIIGRSSSALDHFFDGEMANLRVYDNVLAQTDIDDLYAEGTDQTVIPTTNGLIAHYKLNGNALDETATYNGTENGAMVYSGEQRGDSVASFDGTNDYILTSPLSSYTSMTISKWVYVDALPTTPQAIFGIEQNPDPQNRILAHFPYTDGTCYFDCKEATVGNGRTTFPFDASWYGQWVNVTYVIRSTSAEVYVNNVLKGSSSHPTWSYNFNGQELGIGAIQQIDQPIAVAAYFDGKISDVRLYDRDINVTEVGAIYNEVNEPTDGLILHYPLTIDARADDMWVSNSGTESASILYEDDAEFGSVLKASTTSYITKSGTQFGGTWTFCGWLNVAPNGGIAQSIMFDANYSFRYAQISNGNIGITHGGVSDYHFGIAPIYNEWTHIAFKGDSSTYVKLYINGVYQAQISASIKLPLNWIVGSNDASQYLNGRARDFRYYAKGITDQEITDIYNYEKNFRPIDIDDGSLAYYPLASNSLDNHGAPKQYDGVDTNVTYDGLSAVFNNTAYINLATGDENDFKLSQQTFTAWVKSTNTEGTLFSNNVALWSSGSGSNSGFRIYVVNGSIWGMYVVKSNESYTTENGFSGTNYQIAAYAVHDFTTNLNHIAVVLNGNEMTIYVNGERREYVTTTQSVQFGYTSEVDIGREKNAGSIRRYLTGNVAKARVIGKALSTEQIELIYNTEKGDFI